MLQFLTQGPVFLPGVDTCTSDPELLGAYTTAPPFLSKPSLLSAVPRTSMGHITVPLNTSVPCPSSLETPGLLGYRSPSPNLPPPASDFSREFTGTLVPALLRRPAETLEF